MSGNKIWIFNHYATNMFYEKTGRHQGLAKYLVRDGYNIKIFCANTIHSSTDIIDIDNQLYMQKSGPDGVDYVFVKSSPYQGNGLSRIKNMLLFWKNVKSVASKYIKQGDKPDVIIASSVHPFTLVAGLQLGKKYNIPCICEIRDLWPESIVAYGKAGANNPLIKMLYLLEKQIYKKADLIIFTMAGGYQYILDKGWQKAIDMEKVRYICNGADGELFRYDIENFTVDDRDLDSELYKIVYAGSIREADTTVPKLVDLADSLRKKNIDDVKIIVYGDGDLREELEQRCMEEKLQNIVFKGRVDKKYIPYILSKCDLNVLNLTDSLVAKYGGSQNKLFEYLMSGKPIIAGENNPFSIINQYDCGISKPFENMEEIVESILKLKSMEESIKENVLNAAKEFEFSKLAVDLAECCQEVMRK